MGYKGFIISGTDTGIGKTVASAMLTLALEGNYWKPIQSGIEDTVDTKAVQQMSGLPDDRFFPERYVLTEPLSPHRAAEFDGVEVDPAYLALPESDRTLIVEGAGGLMVPLTRDKLQINQFKKWQKQSEDFPLILCARTSLGTINHTLLSLEALWDRKMNIHGLIFLGDDNPDNIRTIADFSKARVLGHIPMMDDITPAALMQVFERNFERNDFK